LAGIAASFHDVGYGYEVGDNFDNDKEQEPENKGGMGHEARSAQIARQVMEKAGKEGYDENKIMLVEQAIEDTALEFDKDKGPVQKKPRNELSKILQDADLANFGDKFENCWKSSEKVYKELNGKEFKEANSEEQLKFLQFTYKLIVNKKWNFKWNEEKYKENQVKNAAEIQNKIEKIEKL